MDQARFNRVQVNNADSSTCVVINHDVINLWIAMNRAKLQYAPGLCILQDLSPDISLPYKLYAIIHFGISADTVFLNYFMIVLQVERCNMKSCQCIDHPVRRQVADKGMEHAECIADLSRVLYIFDSIKSLSAFNKADRPPERPIGITPVVLSVLCHEHTWHLPASAFTGGGIIQTLADVPGKGKHILDDKSRLAKDLCVDALKDKVLFLFGIQCYEEGVIDVSVPEFPDVYDPAR
jgi:hypothetical protein